MRRGDVVAAGHRLAERLLAENGITVMRREGYTLRQEDGNAHRIIGRGRTLEAACEDAFALAGTTPLECAQALHLAALLAEDVQWLAAALAALLESEPDLVAALESDTDEDTDEAEGQW